MNDTEQIPSADIRTPKWRPSTGNLAFVIFYFLILPALVATGIFSVSGWWWLGLLFIYLLYWLFTLILALAAARIFYAHPPLKGQPPSLRRLIDIGPLKVLSEVAVRYFCEAVDRHFSRRRAVAACFVSYVLSIYGFAWFYTHLSRIDPKAFNVGSLDLFDAFYFSTVTAATVGYGDILPLSTCARLAVTGEIYVSFAYAVLLFSILATSVRTSPASPNDT